ncbi:MAG: thiamine pyrophosphate-dependent enzyme [Bdellovibrionota bacterium]
MSSIYNRAEIIEKRFFSLVESENLPPARVQIYLSDTDLQPEDVVDLFESQVISRCLDLRARELKNENLCYYTIGSSGHEGNAVYGKVFRTTDMAFLHYRSGGFMAQRAKAYPGSTSIYDSLLSFAASSEDPISGGRHKVFGSRNLMVPPQTSTIASHLPKAIGAALSIQRAKDLAIPSLLPSDSVVLCSFGDASSNHATAQSAFNTAGWMAYQGLRLPLIFMCEDNGIGISVPTPDGWIRKNYEARPGLQYVYADGLHLLHTYLAGREAERMARTHKQPVFLHTSTVRLMAHAGSDPEWTYNAMEKIEATENNDPLLHSARILIENGILNSKEILDLYKGVRERVTKVSNYAVTRPKLKRPQEVRASITACTEPRATPDIPSDAERAALFGRDFEKMSTTPQHMAKLINYGLADILLRYKNSVIFGEDVAAKGGVYNVTDGLFKKFGARRIWNSPLDETSILGTAIGMAHNGFVPIPEIQFLAYVHNAEDQLRGEAATLAYFSQGQFTNPMVMRVAGLAYQKGFGGHFHNDNSLAIFRDIPGLILAIPSNGADAVKMMRACVREANANGRVVVFVEPIALYMTKDLHQEGDKGWSFSYPDIDEEIKIGEIGIHGDGRDLCIVTYGNGTYYSLQAVKELEEKHGIKARVLDMRWLNNVDWKVLTEQVSQCKKLLVVEECRKTGSFSEYIVSGLVERSMSHRGQRSIMNELPQIRILAADDCFIPLGYAAAAGLPKKNEILQAAGELFEILELQNLSNDLNGLWGEL